MISSRNTLIEPPSTIKVNVIVTLKHGIISDGINIQLLAAKKPPDFLGACFACCQFPTKIVYEFLANNS